MVRASCRLCEERSDAAIHCYSCVSLLTLRCARNDRTVINTKPYFEMGSDIKT